MDATCKALYDRFIAMGFVPDADNERSLSHPNYTPTEGCETHVIFHDDYLDYNYSGDALEKFIINEFKSEIMEYLANGPFKGYERYRVQFTQWSVFDEFISAVVMCDTLDLNSDEPMVFYNMRTQTSNITPGVINTLEELVAKYGVFDPKNDSPGKTRVVEQLARAGFERIAKAAFIHPEFPACVKYDNVLYVTNKGMRKCAFSNQLEQLIINLFSKDAIDSAESALQQYKKYEISISQWRIARNGLLAEIHCNGMRLFRWGEVIYNVVTGDITLTINGWSYETLWDYIRTHSNIDEIIHELSVQFKQLTKDLADAKKDQNNDPN